VRIFGKDLKFYIKLFIIYYLFYINNKLLIGLLFVLNQTRKNLETRNLKNFPSKNCNRFIDEESKENTRSGIIKQEKGMGRVGQCSFLVTFNK
jgi:hypothetical protein